MNPDSGNYDELKKKLAKLENTAQKYMDMYVDELISREKLNEKLGSVNSEIEAVKNDLKMIETKVNKSERLEEIISDTVKSMESSADLCSMTNAELKKIVNKITVDKDGKIDVYLNLMDDLGLSEDFLVCTDHT